MSNKNPNHRNLFRLLYHGNKAQIEKLERDKDKPDFLDHNLYDLYYLLNDEIKELNNELDKHINLANDYDNIDMLRDAIEQEAADVANFAHMIILKCKDLKGEL